MLDLFFWSLQEQVDFDLTKPLQLKMTENLHRQEIQGN